MSEITTLKRSRMQDDGLDDWQRYVSEAQLDGLSTKLAQRLRHGARPLSESETAAPDLLIDTRNIRQHATSLTVRSYTYAVLRLS